MTRYDELRMQQGVAHEEQWVRLNHPDAVKIEPGFGFDALKNTCRAMWHLDQALSSRAIPATS